MPSEPNHDPNLSTRPPVQTGVSHAADPPAPPADPTTSTIPGQRAMGGVVEQLRGARSTARRTLVLQRAFEIIAAAAVVALILALADYFLRLPRPLRIVHWTAGVVCVVFAWRRWGLPAWRFNPPLTDVASRLERTNPEVRGVLASAVDFDAMTPRDTDPEMMRALERRVIQNASGSWKREMASGLVNPRLMRRAAGWAGVALLAVAALLPVSPKLWAIGAQRVALPFAEVSWPKRTGVTDLTATGVHPMGEALPLQASLIRSPWSPGNTPVAVRYRTVVDGRESGERRELLTWQRVRAGDGQTDGELFERLIEPMGDEIVYRFETDDDQTDWRRVKIVERPRIESASATITPPEYAAGLIGIDGESAPLRSIDLGNGSDERAVAPASLAGSAVSLTLTLNKPVSPTPAANESLEAIGASVVRDPTDPRRWTLAWTLDKPARLALSMIDEHGIESADEAVFRFDASEDRPASATVTEPSSDRLVLPTARVRVVGEGRDDVALTWVALERRRMVPAGGETGTPSGPGGALEPAAEDGAEVVRVEAAGARTMNAEATLDLSVLGLRPGDELHLTALAMDVLGAGTGADATRSAVRVLRIISETEFVEQIRGMLGEVRQGAIRAEDQQAEVRRETADRGPSRTGRRGQSQVSERVARLSDAMQRIDSMVRENALNDEALQELLGESALAIQEAGRASAEAQRALDEAAARAEAERPEGGQTPEPELNEEETKQVDEAQERVEGELERLISMLDRGEDSWLVRNSLERLAREQQELREQTEAAGVATAGKSIEQLDQRERSDLERIVARQEELARQLDELVDDIRQREQEMREADPASAQGMSQAADRAEREQVSRQMQDAAQQAGQNQMTNAAQQQQQAQDALEEMLEDLDRGEQARAEVLRRALQSAIDSIKGLIRAQESEIAALNAAGDDAGALARLDKGMIELNRNTLGVIDLARGEGEAMAGVVRLLDRAGGSQEDAIVGLRRAPVDGGKVMAAETQSLTSLNEALAEAERLAEQMDQAEQERKRRELQKAYREALELQVGVRSETEPLAQLEEIGRRERVLVRRLVEPQGAIRAMMDEVLTKTAELADARVFVYAHERATAAMQRAGGSLEAAEPKAALAAQDRAISTLRSIIESLRDEPGDQEFADQEQQGGGGGGGAGQQQPLIPPLKELRLLRSLQVEAMELTRLAGEGGAAADLGEAAALQRELSQIGNDLLGRMQNAAGGGGVPVGDGIDEESGRGEGSSDETDDGSGDAGSGGDNRGEEPTP